jgi:gamma-glutamyltranspeptidase
MTQITIDLPEELARRLEGLASALHKSVQQVALEGLESITVPGTPAALLDAMRQPPYLSALDVAELEAAISRGQLPVREQGVLES